MNWVLKTSFRFNILDCRLKLRGRKRKRCLRLSSTWGSFKYVRVSDLYFKPGKQIAYNCRISCEMLILSMRRMRLCGWPCKKWGEEVPIPLVLFSGLTLFWRKVSVFTVRPREIMFQVEDRISSLNTWSTFGGVVGKTLTFNHPRFEREKFSFKRVISCVINTIAGGNTMMSAIHWI